MGSALDGITVLDLTEGMAGALASMFLCDNGARVIRVDVPDTEEQRSDPGYAVWDRGKESIFLDLSRALSDLQTDGKGVSETSAKGMDLSNF
ncbi:MAG: CoA transferase, partial [Chloroflexi bacterium]|nr:CoA transferase [Chloroflexota bacterium]